MEALADFRPETQNAEALRKFDGPTKGVDGPTKIAGAPGGRNSEGRYPPRPRTKDEARAAIKRRLLGPPLRGTITERRGDRFIKSGSRVEAGEVAALGMIERRLPAIPVPRMHHHHTDPDGIITIEMDFVDGQTLSDAWPDLSPEDKLGIAEQLRSIIVAMRSLEPGSSSIGPCDGGPALDQRTYSTHRGGPFPAEEAFNEWLIDGTARTTPSNLVSAFRSRWRSDHRLVFSHGDLGQQNVIVRDARIVALVDWQHSGWYPEHWDFLKFFSCLGRGSDWFELASVIFPETYFDELLLYQFLKRYQLP
ncbi:MAG: hypothetical protein M1832_000641 [Thelocarpon impressellum]|nr:MAG: hypothetical protein M1832_000641 [Thelocarpon impressellum]